MTTPNWQRWSAELSALRLVRVVAAMAVGWTAWPFHLLLFSVLMPVIVLNSPTRLIAALSALGYYLAASSGVPGGAAVFFGAGASWWLGISLWLGAGIVNMLPWAVFWRKYYTSRVLAGITLLVLVVQSIPPLGVIGWANPITSAGWLYPSMGMYGLALTALWISVIAAGEIYWIIPLAMISFFANAGCFPLANHVKGIDTNYGGVVSGTRDFRAEYTRNLKAVFATEAALHRTKAQILVLPETVAGTWTISREILWRRVELLAAHQNRVVAVGAEKLLPLAGYENGVILMGRKGYRFYPQRVPVPISMWIPWDSNGARKDWFGNGIARYDGQKIGYVICYEQLLVWPEVVTGYMTPDIVVGMANDWWAKKTSIPSIQRMAMNAWGRLFRWDMATAINS